MKKILLFSTFTFLTALFFVQCSEDDSTTTFSDPAHVARFLEGSNEMVVPENSTDIIDVSVLLNYDSDVPVPVKYTISGDTHAFEVLSEPGVAVVPANKRRGHILLKPIDNNDINDPDLAITINIVKGDGSVLTQDEVMPIGNAVQIVRLADDECPSAMSSTYTAQPYAFGESAPTYTATLTPVAGTDNKFAIDSCWGPDFVAWATGNNAYSGLYVYSGVITINPDNSITVAGDDGWGTGGSGTYTPDPAGKFAFTLTQALFTTSFTVDVELTGNCD